MDVAGRHRVEDMSMTAKGSTRRRAILEVARREIVDHGIDGLVLRRVADEADVALGNLQYYFPTRSALVEAVVRTEAAADLDIIADATTAGADPATSLRRIVTDLLRRWMGEPRAVYLSAGSVALHDAALAAVLDEVWSAFYDAITAVIGALDPSADPTEVRARSVTITALVDGASLQRPRVFDIDADGFVDRIATLAVEIAARSAA